MMSSTDECTSDDDEKVRQTNAKRARYRRNLDADYLQENHDDDVCSQTRRKWNSWHHVSDLQVLLSDNDIERPPNCIPNEAINDIQFSDTEKIESNKSSLLSLCSSKSNNNELLYKNIAHEACENANKTTGDNSCISPNNQNLERTTNHNNQNYCYEQVDVNNDNNNGYYEQEIHDGNRSEYGFDEKLNINDSNQNYCYEQVNENNDNNNGYYEQEIQDDGNSEYGFDKKLNEHDGRDNYTSASDSCTDGSDSSDENEDDLTMPSKNDRVIFNKVMFESSNLSVRDIVILCSAFSLRFQLSDEGQLELIDLLKICAGPLFHDLSLSKHVISQCFSTQIENLTYHYFCSKCSKKIVYSATAKERLKSKSSICNECETRNLIRTNSPNYFISIDLSYQIMQLFTSDHIFDNLLKNVQARTTTISNDNKIKDVYDGLICKKMLKTHKSKEFEYLLTLNFNTDGAPLTRSGKRAFWPLQLILNDLSPKLRFEYVLLAGLLITAKEPKSDLMNLYMSKFREQMNKLYTKGIVFIKNNVKYVFKLCVANCAVDSVARPVTQNRLQFNGYCGCSWCYQLGLYIDSVKGIRYLFEQEAIIRTHETHLSDVRLAMETGSSKRGVKGYSSLQDLHNFDMVWSYSYEYMHGLLLGVTLQIWNEWKSGSSPYKLTNKDIAAIERRYLSITPSHEIHRLPRAGIFQGSMKPKASEMKSWLLCFSLPCLNGILEEEALVHYSLLVKSAYTLLKSEISENELRECEFDLLKFVCEYEMLYGKERMTFNVHALLHIAESIRQSGPICMNSAFPFESNIYTLKTYIKGSNGMDRQMAKKTLQTWIFKTGNTKSLSSSHEVQNYCNNLYRPRRLINFHKDRDSNVTYVGKEVEKDNDLQGSVYDKCIFKGIVYHSIQYKRANKTDDTIVQLQTEELGRILKIIDVNGQCYFKISLFEMFSDNPFEGVSHIKKIKSENNTYTIYTLINDIKCKVMVVNAKNARYLCSLPNSIEVQ